jgi:tetratricopeptide (TPR) repeat protein
MTPADNMPDFDSMTPEEIQVWLESLAKRQGASEGFLTEANMEVAEIDPDTVVIDEPGYVPFGETAPPRSETPPPTARASAPPPPTLPPEPIIEPQRRDEDEIETIASSPSDAGALAWLESLAADQSDDLFNLDITNIEEDEYLEDEAAEQETPTLADPAAWLEDLARSEGVGETPVTAAASPLPPAPQDTMNWLESLAKRQGAAEEELLTSANMEIPETDASEVESEEYTPFTFDSPLTPRGAAVMPPPASGTPSDPASWLESLAAEQGYSEQGVTETQPNDELDFSIEGIRAAIEAGTVTPEQMQVYLAHQAEISAEQEAEAERLAELNAEVPPIPAEIPDWLLEGVQPVAQATPVEDDKPPIESLFDEPAEATPDMPDWLKEDMMEQAPTSIESIFAQTGTMPRVNVDDDAEDIPMPLDIDPNDPWVEAFDLEHEQGEIDIDNPPEWYTHNISDPQRIAQVEQMAGESASEAAPEAETAAPVPLMESPLPEEDLLPEGEAQDVPRWLSYVLPHDAEVAAEIASAEPADILTEADVADDALFEADEMPDWLREVEADIAPGEIPDWLIDSAEPEPSAQTPILEETRPVSQPSPAPKPAPAAPLPGSAALEHARSSMQAGDVESSLAEYEALVRASVDIDAVVEDLSAAVRQHRNNPALYRVLGDGYMRQGKLQQALDTYREALNQL